MSGRDGQCGHSSGLSVVSIVLTRCPVSDHTLRTDRQPRAGYDIDHGLIGTSWLAGWVGGRSPVNATMFNVNIANNEPSVDPTLCPKKLNTLSLSISLSNIDRFSKIPSLAHPVDNLR